uniref:Uncharacterized protein n=1 Tax=Panagrolaimus davidi TaxID=227884 RepID=A0A914PBX7_9BILA
MIKRLQNLYNEMDDYRKDGDGIIETLISDKTEAESNLQEENDVCTKVTDLYNSTADDEEQAIKKCEQQIKKLEETLEQGKKANENRKEKMETSEIVTFGTFFASIVCSVGAFRFPILLIPAGILTATSIGGTIVRISEKDEVNLDEIRNQMQTQRNNINLCQNRISAAKQSVESKQRDIDQLTMKIQDFKVKIQKYREAVILTSFCKKVIFHWLQFLNKLTVSMNRLEYHFAADTEMVAVKDTVAYQKYVEFITGFDADKSLKAATNIRRITSMDVFDMMNGSSF